MSELAESPAMEPVETAEQTDDSSPGMTSEIGESGPADVADQPQAAGDSPLQNVGDLANGAEAGGTAALQEAGNAATAVEAGGGAVLQETGDLANRAEADGSAVLHEAGDLAVQAEANGAMALSEAGQVAAEAERIGGDTLQSAGETAGRLETDADGLLSGAEWNPGMPPEIGDSGPASPVELTALAEPGESSDAVAATAFDLVGSHSAEPGESGPADEQSPDGGGHAIAEVAAFAIAPHLVGLEKLVEVATGAVGAAADGSAMAPGEQPSGRDQAR